MYLFIRSYRSRCRGVSTVNLLVLKVRADRLDGTVIGPCVRIITVSKQPFQGSSACLAPLSAPAFVEVQGFDSVFLTKHKGDAK